MRHTVLNLHIVIDVLSLTFFQTQSDEQHESLQGHIGVLQKEVKAREARELKFKQLALKAKKEANDYKAKVMSHLHSYKPLSIIYILISLNYPTTKRINVAPAGFLIMLHYKGLYTFLAVQSYFSP